MNSLKIMATERSKTVGAIRIMLAVIFMMTGVMKIALSKFGAAWSIQLVEANIPFSNFVYWFVPIVEILIGITLLVGYFSRVGASVIIPIMLVGIYVHLTVSNPDAFPAQPQAPIVPILVLFMAVTILVRGGGSWSKDLALSCDENVCQH
jgi:uncharacterized membrane protein YphA (DoxX/SURF4 family)